LVKYTMLIHRRQTMIVHMEDVLRADHKETLREEYKVHSGTDLRPKFHPLTNVCSVDGTSGAGHR
jgi:hypothetical protein